MKKLLAVVAVVAVVGFSGVSFAMKSHEVMGEVVKMEDQMVDVKDSEGKIHSMHVDKTTKVTGEIVVGAHVKAEMHASGHATKVAVEAMDKNGKTKETKEDMKETKEDMPQ